MVYEDPRKADAMIARLSDLLRETINDSEAQEVPLDREVETLQLYLDIMRQRFEDKLKVDVGVSPEVQKALVPHLLLQPLVENSIRHGTDPQSHAVKISVTAEREGAHTRCAFATWPRPAKKRLRRGTGLSNTAERLENSTAPRAHLGIRELRMAGCRSPWRCPSGHDPGADRR